MIALKRHHTPIWYRVRLVRCDLGSTLSFPLAARSLEEARVQALEHYRRLRSCAEVEVLEVRRLATVA